MAMAAKLKIRLNPDALPVLEFNEPVSGNELEGLLVRAIRRFELQPGTRRPLEAVLKEEISGFRPSRHTSQLELMDLLAVNECTDERFLPPRFRNLSGAEVDRRIEELRKNS
ncbi:MAG: hypothetical protein GY950_02610 [bacterium]|nr:hypothetical protein [bacterium]